MLRAFSDGPTDRQTDRPTDGPTKRGVDSRSTRLKIFPYKLLQMWKEKEKFASRFQERGRAKPGTGERERRGGGGDVEERLIPVHYIMILHNDLTR